MTRASGEPPTGTPSPEREFPAVLPAKLSAPDRGGLPEVVTLSRDAEGRGDLGLGGVFEEEARFLNRDGGFNSRRVGLGAASINPYTWLLGLSWPRFFGMTLALYLLLNGLFGVVFYLIGPVGLSEMPPPGWKRFLASFFFSVQTFGTIGFGHVYPKSLIANLVVTVEAFVGLMAVALVTGMLFARFSRAPHRVLFSRQAVVAPYRGGRGLMFRAVNGRQSELLDASVEVILSLRGEARIQGNSATLPRRSFNPLTLERANVTFFPLGWTVVHPITPDSPLHGLDADALRAQDAELMVVFRAEDEVSGQTVQTRTSYHSNEICWGERFKPMYVRQGKLLAVDARKLSDTEQAELPPEEDGAGQ